MLRTAEKKTEIITYKSKVENKNFNLTRVLPGKYLAWAFVDLDSNEVYSYGNAEPFKYSEKFVYYPDTLNLRPRWPVGDMVLDLND